MGVYQIIKILEKPLHPHAAVYGTQTPLGVHLGVETHLGARVGPRGVMQGTQTPLGAHPTMWVLQAPFSASSLPVLPQSPAYTLVWTRQNHGTLPSRAMDFNGILTIRNVQPEDAGVYVCTGSNMLDMDEGTATLYVQGAFLLLPKP